MKKYVKIRYIFKRNNNGIMLRWPKKRPLTLLSLVVLVVCIGCGSPYGDSRPLIGITSVYQVDPNNGSAVNVVGFAYVNAVAENGGVPVVLPAVADIDIIRRYIEKLDGLVLIGGDDIPPESYGQQPHETVKIIPQQRYDFERHLIAMWLSEGKPILGICLGMQFANVVSGGSLIQDIPSQLGTTVDHQRKYHRVHIKPDSILAEILNAEQAHVFSAHHQAVDKVGQSLKITARADDGVIEALERTKGGFGLFVQWHPESMKDTTHRDAIYGALIKAARDKNQN